MGILKASDNEIIEAFNQSDSVKDMAIKLNMAPKTIRRRLHSLSLKYPVINKKFSNEQAIKLYAQYKSINIIAEILGVCKQSIHERLKKMGCVLEGSGRKITKDEVETIKNYYKNTPEEEFERQCLLGLLPKGTTLTRVEHIVAKLGVGCKTRKASQKSRDALSNTKKGKEPACSFKGHTHTKTAKLQMSQASKKMWKDHPSFNTEEARERIAQRARINGRNSLNENMYSRCKRGHYDINGKLIYFRSKWEPNYALYLDFLKKNNQIKDWEYEAHRFEFPVKRGCTCYTPDFKVTNTDNSTEWHEVKGWMDKKSKTKLNRMAIHFPQEKIILIDEKSYKNIKSQVAKMLKWY